MISFHSLEDRIVKTFMRDGERGCTCPPDFPVCVCGNEPVLRASLAGRFGQAMTSWRRTLARRRRSCAWRSRSDGPWSAAVA